MPIQLGIVYVGICAMTKNLKKYSNKLVKIVFADPSDFDSRFDEKFDPVKCCAVGWLINETKYCFRLAWLFDGINGPSAGIAIPKGSVIYLPYTMKVRKIDLLMISEVKA